MGLKPSGQISTNFLLLIVFLNGFVLMTFEIVGSRVLAPFLGSSTFVWSSIIGVILAALSIGYSIGGKWADRNPSPKRMSQLILTASITLLIMNLSKNSVLTLLSSFSGSLLLKSTLASLLLFALPSFFMATVLPFAIRIAVTSIEKSGALMGRFYAVSTLGSILGTFAGAVLFIPYLGTTRIIWLLAFILLICALLSYRRGNQSTLALVALLLAGNGVYAFKTKNYIDIDTQYNRVWIYDVEHENQQQRHLMLNGHVNSGMNIDDTKDDLIFDYTRYYRLVEHFVPNFEHCLMLGGGGFSFPKYYQSNYENKHLDVVEIDPELSEIAGKHFDFKANKNTTVFADDARPFLSNSTLQYDAVFCDVFSSLLDVPFYMTTIESYQLIHKSMKPNGVLIINVLADQKGSSAEYLYSQLKTLKEVFAQVEVFCVQDFTSNRAKNFMLVAFPQASNWKHQNEDETIQFMLDHHVQLEEVDRGIVMTDDYAPANWMLVN